MGQVNERCRSQLPLQIAELSRRLRVLPRMDAQATVEGYPPEVPDPPPVGLAAVPLDPAADDAAPVPLPATGRMGSVTSMYVAPADRESRSTASAASHLARGCRASPK